MTDSELIGLAAVLVERALPDDRGDEYRPAVRALREKVAATDSPDDARFLYLLNHFATIDPELRRCVALAAVADNPELYNVATNMLGPDQGIWTESAQSDAPHA